MSDLFIFSVLILSTITAFFAGYGFGKLSVKQNLNFPYDDAKKSTPVQPTINEQTKQKPTHSAVLKMPTPQEIKKAKEKENTQHFWDHFEGKKRDKGVFKIEDGVI